MADQRSSESTAEISEALADDAHRPRTGLVLVADAVPPDPADARGIPPVTMRAPAIRAVSKPRPILAERHGMLLGRQSEREVLDRLVDGARAGRSGVLVLRGEAGIGKTALLAHATRSAPDFRVVRTVGVESEMELPFAALHQLCAPILDRVDRLPEPQRDALRTTFGLSAGAAHDRFFVGLAVLGLLAEAASERSLLCVIDDAQWLDRASAQTLAFVARRLFAESVVMVFATREASETFKELAELPVDGLPSSEALELLTSVVRWPLDVRVREQIVAETRGNPLALLELPFGLTPSQLAGGFGLPGMVSVPDRIEATFLHRIEGLPVQTRWMLLLAAAEPSGDPALLWLAAQQRSVSRIALEPAERAGLLEIGSRVRFRHPLLRSAVYRSASPEARREVHRVLADATDEKVDPDRRAWHRAQAVSGPEEAVAVELERSAARAQSRGGMSAAAAFLERAAALTHEPARRAERSLAAAQTKYEAGSLEDAFGLLAMVEAGAANEDLRARMRLVHAEIAFAARRNSDATELLLKAAHDLEVVEPKLARATYLEAMNAAFFAGRLARGSGIEQASRSALACPPPTGPPGPRDLLLHALAIRSTEGYAAAAALLKQALSALRRETAFEASEARWLALASWAAGDLWDDETWAVLSERHVELVRKAGALTAIPIVLDARTAFYAMSGDLPAAAALLVEMHAAADATGIPTHAYGSLSLAALLGREAELAQLEATLRDAVSRGEGAVLAYLPFAKATLYNGLARYDDALAAARHAGARADDLGAQTWAVPELIEAAVRSKRPDLARPAVEQLLETTRASATDWAAGIEARSLALLSEGPTADGLYREAIERLQGTRMRVDLARANLLYGEWLRRGDRRVDAREPLRAAHTMFTAMGAGAFAERTRLELLATGEKVRKHAVEVRDELTAQERQIAALAREGLSNLEIGSRMFLSPRTVEWHLRKVFGKLGITSRKQLTGALAPGQASR